MWERGVQGLQLMGSLGAHTRPAVPLSCDENIHYRIGKMLNGTPPPMYRLRQSPKLIRSLRLL